MAEWPRAEAYRVTVNLADHDFRNWGRHRQAPRRVLPAGAGGRSISLRVVVPCRGRARRLLIKRDRIRSARHRRAEYVELLNTGPAAVNLTGYSIRLVKRRNNTTYQTIALPGAVTLASGILRDLRERRHRSGLQSRVSPNSDRIQNGSPDALSCSWTAPRSTASPTRETPGKQRGYGGADRQRGDQRRAKPVAVRDAPTVATATATEPTQGGQPTPARPTDVDQGPWVPARSRDQDLGDSSSGATSPLVGKTVNVEAVCR